MNNAYNAADFDSQSEGASLEGQVVQHKARPEWGPAVLVWRREDKSGFQFEDGQIRAFKDDWLHMLVPIAGTLDPTSQLAILLRRRAELAEEEARGGSKRATKPALPFEEQVRRFRVDHPDGFQSAAWSKDIRGEGETRRLKRFRDPALREVKEILSAKSLGGLVDKEQHEDAWKLAVKAMRGTDLVAPSQLRSVKDLAPEAMPAYTTALFALLHGDGPLEPRFDAHVAAVGRQNCSWQLATALLALVHPKEQVCVRPSNFGIQARLLAPHLRISSVPNGRSYAGWLAMSKNVQQKLVDSNTKPRDLMDVYDFIRLTARTS